VPGSTAKFTRAQVGGQTPADWRPDDPVELLGPPRVVTRGGTADVAYPVVIWETGPRTLEVPGPLLLATNGGVDSLPPARITVWLPSR